jgi:pyridine nucleotide-disulfide oxidoreductase family protein
MVYSMVSIGGGKLKHVVLVGGGHAHVYILKQLEQKKWPNTKVTLISSGSYQYYSGMFSGYVEGRYSTEEIRIDLAALCNKANVDFITAAAERIDPVLQTVELSDHKRLDYDLISFNIGSMSSGTRVPGAVERSAFIKPNHNISKVKERLLAKDRVVVVGGGVSGVEMSLSLQAYRNKLGLTHPVCLISAGPLMESAGEKVSKQAVELCISSGIKLKQNDPVIAIYEDHLKLESGTQVLYNEILWLAGPSAPSIFGNSSIETDEQGYLLVNNQLQSIEFPNIFGAGDCITLQSNPSTPKAGVFAVRQSPILWHNLDSCINNTSYQVYEPQTNYLAILSTGGGKALLMYGPFSFHGRWCLRLKHLIDKQFMKKYQ